MLRILPSQPYPPPTMGMARRLATIRDRIQRAAEEAGRAAASIRVVASARALMADPVIDAALAGVRNFCEDYLPEGVTKRPVVDHKVDGLTWHFCGTIPAKKIHLAVEYFDWIHSFDHPTSIRALSDAIAEKKPQTGINLMIEVNNIGTHKRSGVLVEELNSLIDLLAKIKGVRLKGLSFRSELTVTPQDAIRAYENLAELRQNLLNQGVLPPSSDELAIGSSRDFEKAIALGSTMVRLGSALFGPQHPFARQKTKT